MPKSIRIAHRIKIDGVDYSPDQVITFADSVATSLIGAGYGTSTETPQQAVTHDPFPQYAKGSVTHPLNRTLEGVALTVYGDSQGKNPSQGADTGTQVADRLNWRHHFLTYTNRAVAGTRMDEIAAAVASTWGINGRGLALLASGIGNSAAAWGTDGQVTCARFARTCLAYLTARALVNIGSPAFAFNASWNQGVTSTANALVDVGVNGDTIHLLLDTAVGTGGVVEVTMDGALLGTINLGGYKVAQTAAFTIKGMGTGNHTLRLRVVSGTVAVRGYLAPGPTPAQVVYLSVEPNRQDAAALANRKTYLDAILAVLPDFPSAVAVTPGSDWVPAGTVGPDLAHLNDAGNAYMADRVEAVLAGLLVFRQGLNRIDSTSASPVYAFPSPAPLVATTVYLSDSFDRADAAGLGNAETGQTWVQTGGTLAISGNAAVASAVASGTLGAHASVNDGQVDGVHRAQVSTVNAGIYFRGGSDGYGYLLIYSSGAGAWRLTKRASTGFTTVATATASTFAAGSDIAVVCSGSTITCLVNGVQVMQVTDTSYTGTFHGPFAVSVGGTVLSYSHRSA